MKPMFFNAEMVQAVKEGRKTVTRRAVKGYAFEHLQVDVDGSVIGVYQQDEGAVLPAVSFAPYRPGEIVYVPEAWRAVGSWQWVRDFAEKDYGYSVEFRDGGQVEFYFDNAERAEKWEKYLDKPRENWQSPYFMPKEAARLFLRVTDIHVERLQDITEEQATSEGASAGSLQVTGGPWGVEDDPDVWSAVDAFSAIWDSTVKPKDRDLYGWVVNPWVWVIEFERISKEEAQRHG